MLCAPDYGSGLLRGVSILCCDGVWLELHISQHKIIITKSLVFIKFNLHLEVGMIFLLSTPYGSPYGAELNINSSQLDKLLPFLLKSKNTRLLT